MSNFRVIRLETTEHLLSVVCTTALSEFFPPVKLTRCQENTGFMLPSGMSRSSADSSETPAA